MPGLRQDAAQWSTKNWLCVQTTGYEYMDVSLTHKKLQAWTIAWWFFTDYNSTLGYWDTKQALLDFLMVNITIHLAPSSNHIIQAIFVACLTLLYLGCGN